MCGAQIITVCVTTTVTRPSTSTPQSFSTHGRSARFSATTECFLIMATEDREYWILQGNGIKRHNRQRSSGSEQRMPRAVFPAMRSSVRARSRSSTACSKVSGSLLDRHLELGRQVHRFFVSRDGKRERRRAETDLPPENRSWDSSRRSSGSRRRYSYRDRICRRIRPTAARNCKRFIAPQAQKQGRTQPVRRNSAESQPLRKPRRRAPSHVRRRSPRPSERLCAERNEAKHFPARPGQPREMQNPQYTQDPRMRSQQQYRADPRYTGERDPRRVQRDAQNTVYPQNPPYIGQEAMCRAAIPTGR